MSKKIKITDFTPDDKNMNLHTQYGMSLLEKSVEKVGIIESITVSADDKVISGNARQEVMTQKFDGVEPIIIKTNGTRPVIMKRTDINSNTKEFHEAALLANTVSKHNVNLDLEKIEEIAQGEFDIDTQDLGVDNFVLNIDNEFEQVDDFDIKESPELGFFDEYFIVKFKDKNEYKKFITEKNIPFEKSLNTVKNPETSYKKIFEYEDLCSIFGQVGKNND